MLSSLCTMKYLYCNLRALFYYHYHCSDVLEYIQKLLRITKIVMHDCKEYLLLALKFFTNNLASWLKYQQRHKVQKAASYKNYDVNIHMELSTALPKEQFVVISECLPLCNLYWVYSRQLVTRLLHTTCLVLPWKVVH